MTAEIDPQVMTAARDLSDKAKTNPEWLWFNMSTVTFGRWANSPLQAPYIRADLCVLASTHTRTLEALREAREALKAQIAAHYRLCRAAGLSDQDHLDGSAQARAALSRIDAILKEDTAHE